MGFLRFFQNDEEVSTTESVSNSITTITATKGEYEGTTIEFDGSIVIGRDSSCSELIIDNPNVSRMHCTITYSPNDKTYIVTDHSTNGTFIGRECIGKNKCRVVPKGTFIIIGQSSNNFRLD